MATTDPAQRAKTSGAKAEVSAPSIPPQRSRVNISCSLTQQRVDAIFRALVARREIEARIQRSELSDKDL